MSRTPRMLRAAVTLAAFTTLSFLPAAVLAPAAHAQKGRRASQAQRFVGKPVKLADIGLSFVLPKGYGPMTEEQKARMGAGPENARFYAIGPRTTRFDGTTYAAQNTTMTTWMYNSVALFVTAVPGGKASDIAQLSADDEKELTQILEGRRGGGAAAIGGMRVENTARGKVGGKNALFVGGHMDVPGTELTFRHRLCLIIHEGRLYGFRFGSDIESFPTTSRAFERLLASVQWSKPTVPAPKPASSTVAEAGQ